MSANIVIIKYNAGNIQSVLYALERIGVEAEVTDDHEKIMKAEKVIFPGVGEASSAMNNLKQNNLDRVIKELKQPVLGICVGMQLICEHSEENDTNCLGIIPVQVKKFVQGPGLKVPQVGWNDIYDLQTPLFKNIAEHTFIYNVHSYYAVDSDYTIARCNYGVEYAAAVKKDNFYGLQFHTEKSAGAGEDILRNFLDIKS
ncbi:MAG TPA: imidazole glycerol phosphate synthase subunit HisH [Chitinophagaceae bacterium]